MKSSSAWAFVTAFVLTYFSAFLATRWALAAPRAGQTITVRAPQGVNDGDPVVVPPIPATTPGAAAAPPAAKPYPVPAAAPAAPRPVAMYISGCPRVTDAGVRRVVAVELGARLITAGGAAPANVDRVLVSCNGQVARIEAGDPSSPRYAERTLPLDQFKGDGASRAVGLAVLELLAALDHLLPPPPRPAPAAPPPAVSPPANGAAMEVYQQQFVWFYDNFTGGREWTAYQGKYHQPLGGADFYLAIDRPDLKASYYHRRAFQIGMIIGGVGSCLLALTQIREHGALGAGLLVGGAVAFQIGIFFHPDPVNESEARRLADVHNKALKRRLGIANDESARPARAHGGGWRLAAGLAPGGGSVGVTLEF